MANSEHLKIVKQGIKAIKEWQVKNENIPLDLSEVDLSGIDLFEANLRYANFSKAILTKADFGRANLVGTDLSEANLSHSELIETNLIGADLSDANLNGVNLNGADLSLSVLIKTNLREADLSDVNLNGTLFIDVDITSVKCGGTNWVNVDLSQVIGLETVIHKHPSSIGIDTLYKSKGKIPRVFLEGCGVPDTLIDYLPSLIGSIKPFEYYSCFLSHSCKDGDFCQRLFSRMRDEHLRVWYAPEDMKGGRKTFEQIESAIRVYDKLLLVLSENSMQSEWVISEIRWARKREIEEKKRVLFPIRLVDMNTIKKWKCFDADSGKDLAIEVREYHIPDFSNWKDHDSFEKGFNRLLDDLKAEELIKVR